jgi:hypothetical protein
MEQAGKMTAGDCSWAGLRQDPQQEDPASFTYRLLWAGRSESTNPKDIHKFVKDLVGAAGKDRRKTGLVEK